MAKRIITISREFGSGGRFIGEEVAKKLGIAYYDKDIIGRIVLYFFVVIAVIEFTILHPVFKLFFSCFFQYAC